MWKKIVLILTVLAVFMCFPLDVFAFSRNDIVMKGDKDKFVLELQQSLYAKHYLKQKPTGYFGSDTEDALIAFQKKNHLNADGKAGPETRKLLLGKKYKPISETRNVVNRSADKLYPGDKGDNVSELQKLLKKFGYYNYETITGYYGPSTEDAVRSFQRVNNLSVDGIAGSSTLKLLKSGKAKYYTVHLKDKGPDIKAMQTALKKLGYYAGEINGYFDAKTLTSLKAFQKNNAIKDDGKVDKETLAKLYSGSAKKAGTNYKTTTVVIQPASTGKVQKLISYARKNIGKKYSRGAEGPSRFDCSGFVLYCLRHIGIDLPRTSASQSKMSRYRKISKISDLQAGDLIFFKTSSAVVGHVGIYIGNNQFIHCAPHVGVQIRTFEKGQYYYERFRWGRRIFKI